MAAPREFATEARWRRRLEAAIGGGDWRRRLEAEAFLDGNKRVAVAVALVFLASNGILRRPAADRLYDAMIGIAERRVSKSDLVQVFLELFA